MFPGGAERDANVALRRGPATAMPRQFGPISRAPCARTSASSRSCRSRPSTPVSAKPAEMTTSAFTPARSASAAASSTAAAGRQITTRSTSSGSRRSSRSPGRPRPFDPSRLTGNAAPAKSASRMLRKSSPPIVPRRLDAPTTATVRGSKNGRRDAVTATWSRSASSSSNRSVRAIGNVTSIAPPVELPAQLEADGLEHCEHAPVVRHDLRDEPLDAVAGRAIGQLLDEAGPDAAPLVVVGHGEGRLGDARVAEADVVADRDHALRPVLRDRAEQGPALGPVRLEERVDDLGAE